MVIVALTLVLGLAQQPPAPRPFPQPGGDQSTRPVQAPAQTPKGTAPTPPETPAPTVAQAPEPAPREQAAGAPTEDSLGIKIFPGAQFIASYDAGRGQRFYLFGSPSPFAEVVTFYRTQLKQRGDLVFDSPATHEFDVGRFKEDTMAFPPGVTVKDYKSEISDGYPNPGGQPARFPTIIQIVPPPAGDR